METKNFKAGELIFKQGDLELYMYDILYGKVGIYGAYGTPDQKLLTKLQTEEFFGEMGLLEALPRSATAVALEDTSAYLISGNNLADYFTERPATILKIMEHMSARLRALTDDYMAACRTVAEVADMEKQGKEKSGWLKEHIKRFSDAYRDSSSAQQ